MSPICICTPLPQSPAQLLIVELSERWVCSPEHCSLGGGALEVVNDDSSVPTSRRTKNSRSSWLRCSVASVGIGVDVARPRTGARTARSAISEFRTISEIRLCFTPRYQLFKGNRPGARTLGRFALSRRPLIQMSNVWFSGGALEHRLQDWRKI